MEYIAPITLSIIIGLILFYSGRWLERKTSKDFKSLGEWGFIVVIVTSAVNAIIINKLDVGEWNILIAIISMWFMLTFLIQCFGKKSPNKPFKQDK
jgi:hypothetical protein